MCDCGLLCGNKLWVAVMLGGGWLLEEKGTTSPGSSREVLIANLRGSREKPQFAQGLALDSSALSLTHSVRAANNQCRREAYESNSVTMVNNRGCEVIIVLQQTRLVSNQWENNVVYLRHLVISKSRAIILVFARTASSASKLDSPPLKLISLDL